MPMLYFDDYQRRALLTDLNKEAGEKGLTISLLGLAGEAGELLTEYKKQLRDGQAHQLFRERVTEELGDLLWYIASVAHKYGLSLSEVADYNLRKNEERWGERSGTSSPRSAYDTSFPIAEQFPTQLVATLRHTQENGVSQSQFLVNGIPLGDPLSDNAYDADGYRFHDVFHLAYAAVLGWSPVIRKLLNAKRRSNPLVDDVEDGGRAAAIEEGISALVFSYAKDHRFLEGVQEVDSYLLQTIKAMTAHLEVHTRSTGEWERAILEGFSVWRQIVANQTGSLTADFNSHSLTYSNLP
jgi:NTP pyrophosphatase (non-canonical NTP hydrolase)